MVVSAFDNPKSQPGFLHLPPNAWQVVAEIILFLLHTSHEGSPPFFITWPSLGFSFCTWLSGGRFDDFLFSYFLTLICCLLDIDSKLPWGTLYSLLKRCHFGLCWLISVVNNINGWHIIDFVHNNLIKIRHCSIKTISILLWLGSNNIDCCLQLNALDFYEKIADFSAVINTIVAMILRALHYCLMFLIKCEILVPNTSFLLAIIVWDLQHFLASVACLVIWWGPRECLWIS